MKLHKTLVPAVLLAALAVPVPSHGLPKTNWNVPHILENNLENPADISSWLLFRSGTPSPVPNDAVTVTADPEVAINGNSIRFDYTRDSSRQEFLVCTLPLKGFVKFEISVRSEREAFYAIGISDTDGASFHYSRVLPAGRIVKLVVRPADFKLNDDSPVKKRKLDGNKIKDGFWQVDLFTLQNRKDRNRLVLDNLRIHKKPRTILEGDLVFSGQTGRLRGPLLLKGNLIVWNGSKVTLDNDEIETEGDIWVNSSVLVVSNCTWTHRQDYRYQRNMIIQSNSVLDLTGLRIFFPHSQSAVVLDKSSVRMSDCEFTGFGYTMGADPECAIDLDRVKRPGEFLLREKTRFRASGCEDVLYWFFPPPGSRLTFTLPASIIANWESPADLPMSVSLAGMTNMMWGLVAEPDTDITFRDSSLRVFGFYFASNDIPTIGGISNNRTYPDKLFRTAHHRLRLVNSSVATWNFYTRGNARLTLRDSLIGEACSFEQSGMEILGTRCDGSGGYIGAKDDARMVYRWGVVDCDILTQQRGRLDLKDGTIVTGRTLAADQSVITAETNTFRGPAGTSGQGRILIR